jgi:hypothetical protein
MMRKFIVGKRYLTKRLWYFILNKCHGDEILSAKILYRANKKKPEHLFSFIRAALQDGWIFSPGYDEEADPRPVTASIRYFLEWIDFIGWK